MKKKLKLTKKTVANLSDTDKIVGGAAISLKVCIPYPTVGCDTEKECYPSAIECCYTCAVGCESNDLKCW